MQSGRQGIEAVTESSILRLQTLNREKETKESVWAFDNLKASHWKYTSSNKVTTPNPSQVVAQSGGQAFIYMPMSDILIQTSSLSSTSPHY